MSMTFGDDGMEGGGIPRFRTCGRSRALRQDAPPPRRRRQADGALRSCESEMMMRDAGKWAGKRDSNALCDVYSAVHLLFGDVEEERDDVSSDQLFGTLHLACTFVALVHPPTLLALNYKLKHSATLSSLHVGVLASNVAC